MKLTPWLLAVAAFLIVAALAVGFLFKRLLAAEPAPVATVTRQQVPMAVTEISPGTVIQRQHLGLGPAESSEVNKYRDTILSIDTLVGRIARDTIQAAVPLRAEYFYPAGEGPELKVSSPDMRAVAVSVEQDAEMVSGLIKPGNYVDVFMTVDRGPLTSDRDRGDNAMLLKLFDGVRLLAINGSYTQAQNRQGNTVVLELTRQQQELMVLAKSKGEISLTFNPGGPGQGGVSVETAKENRVTLHELLGLEEPTEQQPFVTEQFRNGGRADVFYDADGRPVRNSTSSGGVPLQRNDSVSDWTTTASPTTPSRAAPATPDTSTPPQQQSATRSRFRSVGM